MPTTLPNCKTWRPTITLLKVSGSPFWSRVAGCSKGVIVLAASSAREAKAAKVDDPQEIKLPAHQRSGLASALPRRRTPDGRFGAGRPRPATCRLCWLLLDTASLVKGDKTERSRLAEATKPGRRFRGWRAELRCGRFASWRNQRANRWAHTGASSLRLGVVRRARGARGSPHPAYRWRPGSIAT